MLQSAIPPSPPELLIPPFDEKAAEQARSRQDILTKPRGSLGRLEELSIRIAGMMGDPLPVPEPAAIIVAAGSHGIAEEGVSAFPSSVTSQMIGNFLLGGAGISVISRSVDSSVFVVDAGVHPPVPCQDGLYSVGFAPGTKNFIRERAMTRQQAVRIVSMGIQSVGEVIEKGFRLIGLGEMGIGNTTSASAITAAALGIDPERSTGRGTMINDHGFNRKVKVIRDALALHQPSSHDGLDILSAVGGYEIGFLAGCAIGAASRRVPVVLDGYPSSAAALIGCRMTPGTRDFLIASHRSSEPGHQLLLEELHLQPLLDLSLRLGEGTGAALAIPIIRAASRCLREMATFHSAGVDDQG